MAALIVVAASAGVAALVALSTPLYVFHGSVEGIVGFTGYRLEAFGRPASSPLFEALPLYSIPFYAYALVNTVLSGTAFYALYRRGRVSRVILDLLYGNSLGGLLLFYGFYPNLYRLIEKETSLLLEKVVVTTTIGSIVFEKTWVEQGVAVVLLGEVLPVMSVAQALLGAASYYVLREGEGQQ